jgi:hypothetical protein
MGRALLPFWGLMISVACHPGEDMTLASDPSLSSAPVATTDDAVLRMSVASCAREVNCGNVGREQRFADAAECELAMRHATEAEISPKLCPGGVSEQSLERCLSDLRGMVCFLPLETPGRLLTCRRAMLCGIDINP